MSSAMDKTFVLGNRASLSRESDAQQQSTPAPVSPRPDSKSFFPPPPASPASPLQQPQHNHHYQQQYQPPPCYPSSSSTLSSPFASPAPPALPISPTKGDTPFIPSPFTPKTTYVPKTQYTSTTSGQGSIPISTNTTEAPSEALSKRSSTPPPPQLPPRSLNPDSTNYTINHTTPNNTHYTQDVPAINARPLSSSSVSNRNRSHRHSAQSLASAFPSPFPTLSLPLSASTSPTLSPTHPHSPTNSISPSTSTFAEAKRSRSSHFKTSSSGSTHLSFGGSVSAATASVLAHFSSGHHRKSSASMHRPHSPNNDDTVSIRSYRSSTSGTVSEAGKTEAMSLARPRTDQEIEDRFVDFMNNMGMHEPEQKKAMIGLSVDNKWKLIFQHESQEQTKSRGQQILSNSLATLNHRPARRDTDLAMEHEIVKCLKTLLNNRWGAQEAIKYPPCITALCYSITSPQLHTRKLVVEVLTFLCYCEVPMGHKLVLDGLDQVQDYWKESARFDAWMRILENTIDGRGRFGTMVGMSEDLKKAGTQDGQLIEYVLSNVVFVNALLQVVDDIELRIHLRSQLTTSGLTRIITKMRGLNYDLIDRQLNIYEDEAENDYDDMIEFYNHQILHDMSDPYDVFHALLRSVENSRAYDFFLSLLQHMLLIREEGDLRIRYFQLMDAIVTQVVLDRRGITDDFDQKMGISVHQLVGKLVDQDRLTFAIEDAKQARLELENVTRQKNELELEVGQKDDGMVSQLKANIYSLEDLLRLSRRTIQTLQTKLVDIEVKTQNKLAVQDAQLKHLLKSLQDANSLMADAGMPTGISLGTGGNPDAYPMVDKDKIRKLIEQTKLEGAILQSRYGNHLPSSMAPPDPSLTNDLEKLNGYHYTGPAVMLPGMLSDGSGGSGGSGNGKGGKSSKQ
ncbi:hypothetical protein BGZ52_004645, partial [Haplosporangium bisporale]